MFNWVLVFLVPIIAQLALTLQLAFLVYQDFISLVLPVWLALGNIQAVSSAS